MGSGEYGHIHVSVAENGEAGVAHAYLGHAVRAAQIHRRLKRDDNIKPQSERYLDKN